MNNEAGNKGIKNTPCILSQGIPQKLVLLLMWMIGRDALKLD